MIDTSIKFFYKVDFFIQGAVNVRMTIYSEMVSKRGIFGRIMRGSVEDVRVVAVAKGNEEGRKALLYLVTNANDHFPTCLVPEVVEIMRVNKGERGFEECMGYVKDGFLII